jgi:glycosyltransferase involved in cell wall biosynthesis
MSKVLMAEYHPWQYEVQVGGHKFGRFFLEDGHELLWLANFLNINRLLRRREDDLAYYKHWRRGWTKLDERLYTFTPFAILPYIDFPFLRSEWVASVCLKYTFPSLKKTLRQHAFDEVDVLWIGHPRLYSIVHLVKPRVLVYRMSDDIGQFALEPPTINRVEARICRQADVVFATARRLVDKARQYTERVHYLPNGVDFELFNAPEVTIPDDLAQIPAPRVLYVGAIHHWFDFELLAFLTERLADYSFVLVGPTLGPASVAENVQRLARRENVYALGARPFLGVRRYMRFSDVGLVPFVPNELTHKISPIKMFEYFASGLPVVAPRLDEIERSQSPAMLYSDRQECAALIVRAVHEKTRLAPAAIEFGRANSWRERYQEVREQIEASLGRRS